MTTRRGPLLRARHATPAALLFAAALALPAPRVAAQSFALGAGGAWVNDTGSAAHVTGFRNGEGHLFGEVVLERGVLLQLRVSRFGLPASGEGAPDLKVDAGTLTVSYLFRETWFQVGLSGGVGLFYVVPDDPGPDQVATDPKQTVVGWKGSVLTIFEVSRRVDFRLEGTALLLRTQLSHTPLSLGASVAYHF